MSTNRAQYLLMIVREAQHFMADRMKARVRPHAVDHLPMVTAPKARG